MPGRLAIDRQIDRPEFLADVPAVRRLDRVGVQAFRHAPGQRR
jgi:hypothetical protein